MSLEEIKGLERKSLQHLEDEVSRQVRLYKRETQKIRESDDPVMNTPGKKDYEIGQIRRTFEKNINTIEQQYQVQGQREIEELEQQAALSYIKPSQSDKELVENITDDFLFSFSMAVGDSEKLEDVSKFERSINSMSQEQKVALRRRLPQIMKQLEGDSGGVRRKMQGIGQSLSEIKTEEEGALKLLKQDVASGGLSEYRTLLAAEKVNANRRKQWESSGDTLSGLDFEVEYKRA